MEGGPPRQVPEVPRPGGNLPHQALLHLQHAHHPADRARVQPLLRQPAPVQPRPHQHTRAHPRQVAGLRGRPEHPRGRHRVLHLPSHVLRRDHLRPVPRRVLPRLHPGGVRPLLQDVDRGQRGVRTGRGQAAPGQPDGHEGTSRLGAHPRPEQVHSHGGGVRRHVHRRADRDRRLHGRHRDRDGDPAERDHHLPVLRGVPEGAAGGDGAVWILGWMMMVV
mmetsp:Transcript_59204/g.125849  ORF Transcript_59204/g.125849 Transcript_59204/m.125849 type:complete len:220 (-) Transcript_59204:493-1152(-)